MGEVYRARDPRLGRDVAIKSLPDSLAVGSERVARFQREAQILASLNHPHIAAIYGLEERNESRFLILELVEGDTLARRLRTGPLPLPEALTIARQIADGLQAAHDKGIVHRDLKPANVKITPDGTVKVLDFGLAKLERPADPEVSAQSPTITRDATGQGLILGTPGYMSPEQARGQKVDKRTDIWAFGCVLYEMLTGRAPFPGGTVLDIISSVLHRDPDWNALAPHTPVSLVRLLHRSLAKDPNRRLRDIGDARLDLDDAQGRAIDAMAERSVPWGSRDVVFQRLTEVPGLKETPAVSPDGKMVAFVAVAGGKRQIWIRLLAGGALLQLTRDDREHLQPRWAPDSNTLIYYTPATRAQEGALWEISALGGWPRLVASALGGGDISHDGRRIALLQIVENGAALVAVARDGSGTEWIARLPSGFSYASPRWSPDGRFIALLRFGHAAFATSIEMIAIAGGEWREVVRVSELLGFCWLPDGTGFAYSSAKGSTLLYPGIFNLRTISPDGSGDRHLTFGDHSYVDPDVDRSGRLLVSRVRSRSDIWKIPVAGSPVENTRNAVRVTRQTGHVQTPTVSPDGAEVAYLSDNGGHANLWIARTDGSDSRQITFETDPTMSIGIPAWSPRGDLIVFLRSHAFLPREDADPSDVIGRPAELWAICPDGTGFRRLVTGWAPCWSGDGNWLYYWSLGDSPRRVEKLPIDGGPAVVVREENERLILPAVSADGSTLYFVKPVRSSFFGLGRGTVNEVHRACPEHAPSEVLFSIPGERIPVEMRPGRIHLHINLSPDGQWLATSLIDGGTTNLWALPTSGAQMKPLTDFGEQSVTIARSVSWSADSQYIYAAVAENDTDIVFIDGLIR